MSACGVKRSVRSVKRGHNEVTLFSIFSPCGTRGYVLSECQSKRKGYSCASSRPHPGKGLGVLARLRLIKFRPRGYLSEMGDDG